jgi:hypothetical protein
MSTARAVTAALLLPLLCGSGTVEQKTHDLFATAIPFCRMISERTKYVGRETAVSGLLASTPHGGMIYGKECPNSAIFISGASSEWISPQAKAVFADAYRGDRIVHVPVVILGVLRATPGVSPCSSDSCMRYRMEDAQIIAALPP